MIGEETGANSQEKLDNEQKTLTLLPRRMGSSLTFHLVRSLLSALILNKEASYNMFSLSSL